MPFPDEFVTTRLRAERLTAEHLPELRRMHCDAEVMATLGGMRDEPQTLEYLARNLQHWADYGFGLWIVREAGSDEIAGRAVLRHLTVEGRDEVEVGYGFYPAYWGRGLATEIARACLRLGREQLGLASVVAITLPDNLRSQHVLTKVGLVYEREVSHEGQQHALFRSS
jgi:RimJ/RimL family protein N-acetyltransferase